MMRNASYSLAPPLQWEKEVRLLSVCMLGTIICLSHGVFELTFDKRAGLLFVREVVLTAILLISTYFIFKHPQVLRLKLSVSILAYVALFLGLSAIFSWLWFGQPLYFSLLEERRVLSMLWFFPALWFMLKAQPTMPEINRAFLLSGTVLVAYSLLYYVGLIPDNEVPSDIFVEQYFYADDDPRNLTRYVLGSSLLVVVIPLSLLLALESHACGKREFWSIGVLIGCVFTLLMIDQSRSVLISTLLIAFFALLTKARPLWKPILLAAGLLGALSVVGLLLGAQSEKSQWLINSLLTGQGVRSQTSQIILRELGDTWLWGHGALSVQYNRGFLSIYNENFWLNDVGKLGLLYRFGFLTVLFIAFYGYVLRFLYKAKKRFPDSSIFNVLVWVYVITLITPWGSMLALLPAELGIALGMVMNHENRSRC